MSLFLASTETYKGNDRIVFDGETVTFREETGYVVETSPSFICLKFPGRSVYSNVYGVVYHPAKYFFGHIAEVGDGSITVDEGIYVPVRT